MIKQTKTLLDGGDAAETKVVAELPFGFEGQTTNPSLIAKNPYVTERIAKGEKFTLDELNNFYRSVIEEIDKLLPGISISIEVYVDKETEVETILADAREYNTWTSNAYIKLPITKAGLEAARLAVQEGIKVNMTLCFSQAQAAAVYVATKDAAPGSVLVSPFVGRLDDINLDGVTLIENIQKMYSKGDGHVEVLAASLRHLGHLNRFVEMEVDSVTAPLSVYQDYAAGKEVKTTDKKLEPLAYVDLNLDNDVSEFDLKHELTDIGLEKFVADWKNLLA